MPKTIVETTPTAQTPTPAAAPSDNLSPSLRELVAIFDGPLSEVRFPGVDSKILTDLAGDVEGESVRVEELRQQLDAAHSRFIEVKARLQRVAEQGLAYAKVFAAGDPDLQARLGEINLAGEPKRRKARAAGSEDATSGEGATEGAGEEGGEGDAVVKMPARRGRKPKVAEEAAADDTAAAPAAN